MKPPSSRITEDSTSCPLSIRTQPDSREGVVRYDFFRMGHIPKWAKPWFGKDYARTLRRPFPIQRYWLSTSADAHCDDLDMEREPSEDGCLFIANGCSDSDLFALIVTGAQRGSVWQVGLECIQPLAPSLTFLDWYEYWLEGQNDWFRQF